MSRPLHALTSEAMELDPADRLRLAAELIDSVEGPPSSAWAESWTGELQRRSEAADAREAHGKARGAEWADVRARLLAKRRSS